MKSTGMKWNSSSHGRKRQSPRLAPCWINPPTARPGNPCIRPAGDDHIAVAVEAEAPITPLQSWGVVRAEEQLHSIVVEHGFQFAGWEDGMQGELGGKARNRCPEASSDSHQEWASLRLRQD